MNCLISDMYAKKIQSSVNDSLLTSSGLGFSIDRTGSQPSVDVSGVSLSEAVKVTATTCQQHTQQCDDVVVIDDMSLSASAVNHDGSVVDDQLKVTRHVPDIRFWLARYPAVFTIQFPFQPEC